MQSNTLNKKICVLILNNLTKYEDVGEIVDITYEWLSLFCKNEILESSKILITQAVKHIAVYKSDSAFKFMTLLVKSSSKYKNKSEIENVSPIWLLSSHSYIGAEELNEQKQSGP